MTPSHFADSLEVSRSSISHILNGRNYPTINLLQKIITTFPDISRDWLFFDDGPMIKTESDNISNQNDYYNGNQRQENLIFPDVEQDDQKYGRDFNPEKRLSPGNGLTQPPQQPSVVIKEIDKTKTISRIMIIYSDNTFENFIPESSQYKK